MVRHQNPMSSNAAAPAHRIRSTKCEGNSHVCAADGRNHCYLSKGFKWLRVMGLLISSLPRGGLSFILPCELEKLV